MRLLFSSAVFFAVACATTLATLGFTVVSAHRGRVLAERLAGAEEQQARLKRDLQRNFETRVPLNKSGAGNASSSAAPIASASASAPLPPRTRSPGLSDFAQENPQLWNEFVEVQRVQQGRLYLPLLQRLNFSTAQIERFKEIMAASAARGSDIGAAARAQGLKFSDPAIEKLRAESDAQRKRELVELFSPAGYGEFEAYERALPLRGFVDGLAVEVAATSPLSAQQADRLVQILGDANEPYRRGERGDPQVVDWETADRKAKEILTTEQFAIWQLGVAHNKFGGSRQAQALKAVYDQAVKRMKESYGVNTPRELGK